MCNCLSGTQWDPGDFEYYHWLHLEESRERRCRVFFCSCASCRARSKKPCVGCFLASPSQMRLKKVQLMKQLSYDQECNGSNQVQGWGTVAMALQSMHHDLHLWIFPSLLMASCLSFLVSKCDNNIKQLRVLPTCCFSTVLENAILDLPKSLLNS